MLFYKALDKYVNNKKTDVKNKINKFEADKLKKEELENEISYLTNDINTLDLEIKSLKEDVKQDKINRDNEDIVIKKRKKDNKKIIAYIISLTIISLIILIYKFINNPTISSPNPFLNFLTIVLIYVVPSIIIVLLFILLYNFYKNLNCYNKYVSIHEYDKELLKNKKKLYKDNNKKLDDNKNELIKYLYVDNKVAFDNEIKYSNLLLDRIEQYKIEIKTKKLNLVGEKEFETVFYYLYNDLFNNIEEVLEYIKRNPRKTIRKDKTEIPYIIKTNDFLTNLKYLINDLNYSVLLDDILDDILRDLYKMPNKILDMDIKLDILDNKRIIDNELIISILLKMYR